MAAVVPVAAIRRKMILKKLWQNRAVSRETALTLAEAGVINPNCFGRVNQFLVNRGELGRVGDKRYWLRCENLSRLTKWMLGIKD